jgi:hypothetical protein
VQKLCYVIGPYAAGEDRTEAQNVARATALGALALTRGLVPVTPHLTIGCSALLLGEHGHPEPDRLARDASYGADQESGLAALMASEISELTLFVLLKDDRTPSLGTAIERGLVTFIRAAGTPIIEGNWSDWRPHFEASGLLGLYEAVTAGAVFPRWPGDGTAAPRVSEETLLSILAEAKRQTPLGSRWRHIQEDTPAIVTGHTFLAMPPEGSAFDAEISVRYVHRSGGLEWTRPLTSFCSRYTLDRGSEPIYGWPD